MRNINELLQLLKWEEYKIHHSIEYYQNLLVSEYESRPSQKYPLMNRAPQPKFSIKYNGLFIFWGGGVFGVFFQGLLIKRNLLI